MSLRCGAQEHLSGLGTLFNTTDDGIANDFLLYNEADDQWFNVGSDENGSLQPTYQRANGSSSSLRSATVITPRPCDNR